MSAAERVDAAEVGEKSILPGIDDCRHRSVRRIVNEWACVDCDQDFIPLLAEPVRPRADARRPRLNDINGTRGNW